MADGATLSSSTSYGYIDNIRLSDPVSSSTSITAYSNNSQAQIGNVPPGSVQTVNIQLVDVSKATNVTAAGGSFSSASSYSNQTYEGSYEWFRVPTEANRIYRFTYDSSIGSSGYNRLMIFEKSGAQLFQSTEASGSYTFASGQATTLYVYTPYIQTTVNVTTEDLGSNQSLYNANIHYNQ